MDDLQEALSRMAVEGARLMEHVIVPAAAKMLWTEVEVPSHRPYLVRVLWQVSLAGKKADAVGVAFLVKDADADDACRRVGRVLKDVLPTDVPDGHSFICRCEEPDT